jgi:hypothetical protein
MSMRNPKAFGVRKRAYGSRGRPADAKALLMQLAGKPVKCLGVDLLMLSANGVTTYGVPGHRHSFFPTKHEALKEWIKLNPRSFGHYELIHDDKGWLLRSDRNIQVTGHLGAVYRWLSRPTRLDVARVIKAHRARNSKPSHVRPETLGWRTWNWNARERCLMSPSQGTLWPTPDHMVPKWDTQEVVRGKAGIHACRLPRGDWKLATPPSDMLNGRIVGLVERFGKFVLGTEGWRAEMAVIKELVVPDEATYRLIKHTYPEVIIHLAHERHWTREVIL